MGGNGTILMYHRIADEPNDPFSLCVSTGHFDQQLEVLHEVADVVAVNELRGKSARPRVAVTFDDGYADNLHNALPVVEKIGIPITVFVTSGIVGRPEGFWWDRLADLLVGREEVDLTLSVGGETLRIQEKGPGAGQRALGVLHLRLRPQPAACIDRVIRELSGELGTEAAKPSAAQPLEHEELLRLASSPFVTIGAHTTDHVLLRRQPLTEQIRTITQSKVDLEEMLGRPIVHFAYPFGGTDAFDRSSVGAVQSAGFQTACTTVKGPVTRWSNPLCLPRRAVRDWSGSGFRDELALWGIC
jgi:peptidoglycan/xylan/chitin deacetylase (PgdA/CDA1 family)